MVVPDLFSIVHCLQFVVKQPGFSIEQPSAFVDLGLPDTLALLDYIVSSVLMLQRGSKPRLHRHRP
jgi:hypothetical protein